MKGIKLKSICLGGLNLSQMGRRISGLQIGIGKRGSIVSNPPHVLLEDGGSVLMEDGGKVILEEYGEG